MAEPSTTKLDLKDIPEYKSPRIPSPSIDLAKLAADVLASSSALFSTKRKHFKSYKCISGAELVDIVCKLLAVTRPRATDYCEQMRVKLYLFSFPDKKKQFRDDKNSYYAFKDTSKSLLTVSQPGRPGRTDLDLQSSSEASITENSFSMASTNTTPTSSLPPSSSSPLLPSNSLTISPEDKQRKHHNKNPTIKVARASSWASLVDLQPSAQEPVSEVDLNAASSPSMRHANTNQSKRDNGSLSPKEDSEKPRRGSIGTWHDKDRRRKRESKKFSRFVLASIPDKLDGSNFNSRYSTRILAPGYTVSNFNNIGTLIVTDLMQTYLVSVNNKSGLVSVAYQYPYIMSYHENHKLQLYDIRTEHVKYIYEDPRNYRKISRDSLKKADSPIKSRRKASGERSHSPSKRDLSAHDNVSEVRDRRATLTPIIERDMSTRSLSKSAKGSLKLSSTEPMLLKTDTDLLGRNGISESAPVLPVAGMKDRLVDMANPHASDQNKSAVQSLHLSDNEIIEKNRANCLLLTEQKLVLLTCYQTFYRLLTWSITREEVPVNLKSPRDTTSDAGSHEELESQSQQSTSKDGKKKERKPRDLDFISMLSELDFFSMKESRDKKDKDRTDHSSSAEYENVINFERKCYMVHSNILQPVDQFCKIISKDYLLIGSHHAWQLWNTSACKLEREGELKEEGTSLIKLQANHECVAGSTIDTVYIWFLGQTNDEPVVIRHHTIITELYLDQKYIYFGDRNGTICMRKLTHLLVNPQNPANMYYFNTASESDLNNTSTTPTSSNQEPVIVRASYYENKINLIQKQGPHLLVGHESSKFTVWRVEDGSSEIDLTGSGTSSLTTSNNSNSVGPATGGSVSVPGIVTPIGSPGNSYSLPAPIDRARGLEAPLRVYLVKEYSTNGPVLDLNCDEEGCYFLVRNKRKNAPLEASKLSFYGLGKKLKGDNVILSGHVDTSSKNKNKKDKLQAVNVRLDQVEKTNEDILSNLDRIEKSDRERASKLENELNTWGQAINNKLESQLNVLNRLKPAFDYVVQFQQMQQQLSELTNTNRAEGQQEGTMSTTSTPSTSMEFTNIKSLITKFEGSGSSPNSPPNTEVAVKTPKPRDILSSFHRVTTLFKQTVDEQAKEIEVLKNTVIELREDRQKQTREIEELKNTVQLLVQFVQQQGSGSNVQNTSSHREQEEQGLPRIDESQEEKHLQLNTDNASHTSMLDHEALDMHHHDDNRSVVSDAYSVFSDKRMARVMEEMAQMTDHSSQGSDHPNMDDVSEHHDHVPVGDVSNLHEEEKPKELDDKSVISMANESVKNNDTTEELNDRHLFLDELREEEDDNDESTWASKSVSTARSDMSNVFEIDGDSADHNHQPHVSEGLSFSLTPIEVLNTIRSEANLSNYVDLNALNHEQLYNTVIIPVNPPMTLKTNHRIRTYSGSSFDSSSSMREISDSVTSSSMLSIDKQEDFNSMTTMVSRDTEEEPVKEAEVDAQYEAKSSQSVRSVDHQDEDHDSTSSDDE